MTAALILAAGSMTQNNNRRPTDNIGGVSSIRRLIMVYRQAGLERIVVVTGYDAGRLERHCVNMGAIFLRNGDYENGDMLSSVKVGLKYLRDKCERVFISPSGTPLFTVETVKKIERLNGALLVVPVYNDKPGHPLLLSEPLFDKVLKYDGGGGLEGALSSEGRRLFDVPDEGVVTNVQDAGNLEPLIKKHSLRKIRPELRASLSGEKDFFGPSALRLLELTDETGSLKLACHRMGISYSKGYMMMADIETQLGYPVLISRQGGKHGGYSEITEKGRELMRRYAAFAVECSELAQAAFARHFEGCGLW